MKLPLGTTKFYFDLYLLNSRQHLVINFDCNVECGNLLTKNKQNEKTGLSQSQARTSSSRAQAGSVTPLHGPWLLV